MDLTPYLLNLVIGIISGSAVFFIAWVVVKPYLDRAIALKISRSKKSARNHTLHLRIQAYERMVLFLERINPAEMLVRLHIPGISLKEMQHHIISDIRSEYQHNVAQQLYIESETWAVIKRISEDTISLVNSAAQSLPGHATGTDLGKAILNHLAAIEGENPYDKALIIVKRDIQQLF